MLQLPEHLQKYKVDQNYERYTPIDQATWRYILRQLKNFFSKHAPACYLEGLEKTGISEDCIPRIEEMSQKLEKFGWKAMPVSGFIPPAAFMELQSLSILPIASDMRSLDHLLYTPAPDIVHEAAGHAPIIIDPEYAAYLKEYAQVAKKAIISKEDLNLYEAIRDLSDIKENPASTAEQIKASEERLQKTIKESTHVSEATELSRMNWWTAEYGLIGSLEQPKIFGAGLLSSIGESKACLSDRVKKIPLTVQCIQQTYDITEPQPQLFVTPDFKTLVQVLHEMANKMAYKVGGLEGLKKAQKAQSVNTIQLDTGLQISGVVENFLTDKQGQVCFLKLAGPSQLAVNEKQLEGHSKNYHQHGYSTPLGKFNVVGQLEVQNHVTLNYESGLTVKGTLKSQLQRNDQILLLSFENCTVQINDTVLFQPEWGIYDLALGQNIASVFGGPADRKNYGDTDDFVAARVPTPQYSAAQKELFSLYQSSRNLRNQVPHAPLQTSELEQHFQNIKQKATDHWLLYLELFEILKMTQLSSNLEQQVLEQLMRIKKFNDKLTSVIDDGLRLAHETVHI